MEGESCLAPAADSTEEGDLAQVAGSAEERRPSTTSAMEKGCPLTLGATLLTMVVY